MQSIVDAWRMVLPQEARFEKEIDKNAEAKVVAIAKDMAMQKSWYTCRMKS